MVSHISSLVVCGIPLSVHVWYDVSVATWSLLVVALGLLVGYEFSSKSCNVM
jgi:hypothetical protein